MASRVIPRASEPTGNTTSSAPSFARPPVAGQLTFGWRFVTVITWILVFVAWSGVWKASRELGISTWWLGPPGTPRPIPVLLVPFVAPGVMVALALDNARRLPWYGLGAAAIGVAIGIADLSFIRRLGYVEILIAASGAAVSLASLSGTYREGAGPGGTGIDDET